MSDDARILALQFSNPYVITTINGVQEQIGYRPILSVQRIVSKVQTTVLYGNDLYGITLMSNLDEPTIFRNFLKTFANKPETWVQLAMIPNPPIPYPGLSLAYRPNIPPVASNVLTLLNAGYDAGGYWVEFLGNYFLTFSIFKDWPEVIREGANYKGFQPSQNNPGSGSGSC